MESSQITLFGFIVVGVLILYPITPRYFFDKKPFWLSLGFILVHLGIFGILWQHLPRLILLSVMLFEMGIVSEWDPLSMWPDRYKGKLHAINIILVAAGLVLALSFLIGFPPWLWMIPLLLFLIPNLSEGLKTQKKVMFPLALIVTLVFLGMMGTQIYKKWFKLGGPEPQTSIPIEQTGPPNESGETLVPFNEEGLEPIPTAEDVLESKVKELESKLEHLRHELEEMKKE